MKLRAGLRNKIDEFSCNYVNNQSRGGQLLENNLIDKIPVIQERDYMTTYELWDVAYWKREQGSKQVLDTPDSLSKCITKQAFNTQDDWEKIVLLSQPQLKGIGASRASAVLHLYDTQAYPIIDKHALYSVGLKREWICHENLWREYVSFCRELAKELNVEMRKLDRALWRFSWEMEKKE